VTLGEEPVDEGDGVLVEPVPEDVREEGRVDDEVPFPDKEEDEDKVEESGSPMSNEPVAESVVVTSPTGEAWKVYPGPGSTTGMTTVIFPSEVVTTFFKANVL